MQYRSQVKPPVRCTNVGVIRCGRLGSIATAAMSNPDLSYSRNQPNLFLLCRYD
jgi:hypothetical protein